MIDAIKLEAMLLCSACGERRPRSAFYVHRGNSRGAQSYCKECCRGRSNAAHSRAWRERNKDYAKEAWAAYYAKNREKELARSKAKYRRDGDRIRAQWRSVGDKLAYKAAARRAARVAATPPWASEFLIREAYALARLRTSATGIAWEVDHVVPLVGGTVCGLHVQGNLAVIERRANRAKHNRQWPDMP
jgi:5-methylcytosine-specific restriction endonuclease McrA